MKTIELSRKQLYDLVWSTPITKLTLQYAISVEGLKKLCKQFDIPMPPNGYWSKLKYNKFFIKTELTTVFDGVDKIPLTIREEGNPVNLDQTPLSIKTIEIKNDPKAPLTVPDKLTKPDILIQNTKDLYSKIKKEPYSKKENIDSLGIYVENDNLDRAFRIMDTFIKLLRHRGHTFRRDINNRGPNIAVNDVDFYFHLREAQKRVPATNEYFSSTYAPTGVLVMKIGEGFRAKEWKDGAVKLENQLAKMVAKIELEAEKELEWREECRLHDIQRAEEDRIRKIFEARKEKEVVKTRNFSQMQKNSTKQPSIEIS